MDRFAVVLTHNRPELLYDTVAAIGPQVDLVIVIDNASTPPVLLSDISGHWRTALIRDDGQPPNLSRLWSAGLDAAMIMHENSSNGRGANPYVAFLCDDAPAPPSWFAAVTRAMAGTGAVAGASAPQGFGWDGPPKVKYQADSDLMHRMPGWAFVLDPVSPVRPDEAFRWWYGDTDLDWQARSAGGMVLIGDHPVPNIRPNDFVTAKPELGARAGLDGEAFAAKWGSRPW